MKNSYNMFSSTMSFFRGLLLRKGAVIYSFLLIHSPAFSQIISEGFKGEGKEVGFLEMKVVETDPIIRQAKEAVPFDKPFFLKIKRPDTGKLLGTRTESVTTKIEVPPTVNTIEYKESNPFSFTASKPSTLTSIKIYKLDRSSNIPVRTSIHSPKDPVNSNTGDIYEEDGKSEYIYVKIGPLVAEESFTIEIKWKKFERIKDNNFNETEFIESYLITTTPAALDKRLKNILSPQIGVTSVLFKSNQERYGSRASLIVGVYHQLRPVDPDIPFKAYKWHSLRRFSIFLGLSINSIEEESIRDNLFGSNNIILGGGYQISNAIRISYGSLFFREINPNPVFADRKKLAATSCLSLTLDLKIKDLLGGIVTALGFK